MKIVDIMAKQNKTPKFNGEQMLREDTYSSFTEDSLIFRKSELRIDNNDHDLAFKMK